MKTPLSHLKLSLILTLAILRSQTVIDRAAVAASIAEIKDLRAPVATFRQRCRHLPGDFPVDAVHPEIPGVRGDCRMGGSMAGNGNGDIESPGESMCASEQLIRAGLIRGDPIAPVETRLGAVSLKRTADAGVSFDDPPQIRNVLAFTDVPCGIAPEIDRKRSTMACSRRAASGRMTTCVRRRTARKRDRRISLWRFDARRLHDRG
jgi:hypothetical protein